MNLPPMIALLLGSLLAATGQLFFKIGANGASQPHDFVNLRIASGLAAYTLGTVLWIWALSKVPLNVAYGFTALTFVLVFAGSGLFLRESFSPSTYVGLALVLAGFFCLTLAPR